jgi:uncharacterized membrane protein YccC
MTRFGNLSIKRSLLAIVGSPLLGGFAWGVLNPSSGWETLVGRLIHGILAAPMSLFMVFTRPDKVPSWPLVAVALLILLLAAMRWPRSHPAPADQWLNRTCGCKLHSNQTGSAAGQSTRR